MHDYMSDMRSSRVIFFLGVAVAAGCAAQAATDDETSGADALIGDYTTPDPGNIWTKNVDLARMKVGEETVLPDEAEMFAGFAADIQSMQGRLAAVNGKKVERGFHAKAHACVAGETHIQVPASLGAAKQGLF